MALEPFHLLVDGVKVMSCLCQAGGEAAWSGHSRNDSGSERQHQLLARKCSLIGKAVATGKVTEQQRAESRTFLKIYIIQ
jgi:hypothetical protein